MDNVIVYRAEGVFAVVNTLRVYLLARVFKHASLRADLSACIRQPPLPRNPLLPNDRREDDSVLREPFTMPSVSPETAYDASGCMCYAGCIGHVDRARLRLCDQACIRRAKGKPRASVRVRGTTLLFTASADALLPCCQAIYSVCLLWVAMLFITAFWYRVAETQVGRPGPALLAPRFASYERAS